MFQECDQHLGARGRLHNHNRQMCWPIKTVIIFFYRNNVEIKRYKTWLVLKCDLNARDRNENG